MIHSVQSGQGSKPCLSVCLSVLCLMKEQPGSEPASRSPSPLETEKPVGAKLFFHKGWQAEAVSFHPQQG